MIANIAAASLLNVQAASLLAANLHRSKRHGEALIVYNQIAETPNPPAQVYYNQAVELRALGRHQEALIPLKNFLAAKPDDFLAWTNAGDSCRELGHTAAAVTMFARALELAPGTKQVRENMAQAHHNLSRALWMNGDLPAAIKHAEAAVELNGEDPEYRMGLGEMQLVNNLFPEGWENYEARFEKMRVASNG